MRECNGCTYCCDGHLSGTVEGIKFGSMNPCHNLLSTGCAKYSERPNMCSDYYCAWSQELLPEWMKPNECGTVVSVEIDSIGRQYLKAVSTDMSEACEHEIKSFVDKYNSYFVKVIPITLNT